MLMDSLLCYPLRTAKVDVNRVAIFFNYFCSLDKVRGVIGTELGHQGPVGITCRPDVGSECTEEQEIN